MSFRISKPSYQSLLVDVYAYDMRISTATATVIVSSSDIAFLVTNRHVVTGQHQETGVLLSKHGAIPDRLMVSHNAKRGLGIFESVEVKLLYENGEPRWIEHPAWGKEADIVALPIDVPSTVALYPYRASYKTDLSIEPSNRVSVVGFPFGEKTGPSFAIWSTGFVASEPEIDHGGKPIFLIDCRARQGQSCSPVILYSNGGGVIEHDNGIQEVTSAIKLLGIYSGRINPESDLGNVWKSSVVAELVDYASALLCDK